MYNLPMITGNLDILIVSNEKEYAQAMAVRREVFVDELKIAENKEFDGNDFGATHILALDNGVPVGTMRIRYFSDFVKMERMCVIKDYRKTDASEQIMQKAMKFAAQKGYKKTYGVCKKELLNRWKQNGFEPVLRAPCVEQNGMTLVPVYAYLPEVDNFITMQTNPDILNAKEGDWFDNDMSDGLLRIKSMTDKVKKIKQSSNADEQSIQNSFIPQTLYNADDKSY